MGTDDTQRMLGQLDGKLDELIRSSEAWHRDHNDRHEKIDQKLESHAADINTAKGAKAAILTAAGAVAGLVSIALAAAERFFK